MAGSRQSHELPNPYHGLIVRYSNVAEAPLRDEGAGCIEASTSKLRQAIEHMPMLTFAITATGRPIVPELLSDADWQSVKDSYRIGDFLTPCCGAPAIPKTSPNFVKFFAHYSEECATAPESVWHLATKARIVQELAVMAITATLEVPTHGLAGKLTSDVYFEVNGRRMAIEVQHSYQHLNDYVRRQKKYTEHGIENYWLLYKPRYLTLVKSIARFRLRHELAGKVPDTGTIPSCLPDLPMALFEPGPQGGIVSGAGGWHISMRSWLQCLIGRVFAFKDDRWLPQSKEMSILRAGSS